MSRSEIRGQVAAGRRQPAAILRMIGSSILSVGSAAMVGFMMFLTFADVVGRYVFNSPILGAYEITEVLMGLMIFGGLPLISTKRTHITVDFLSSALPPRLKPIQSVAINLVCSIVAGVLGWRAWIYGHRLAEAGERTLQLRLSWGVIIYIVSVLLFLTTLAFLANIWATVRDTKSGKTEE